MGDVIGQFLSLAVGVAISPVPIAALLLMLVTRRAKTNSPLFLLGWLVGLSVVGAIVLLIPGMETGQGEPTTANGIVKGALGLLLLFGAVKAWQGRPKEGEIAEAPGWMQKVEGFGGGAALGIGVLLTAGNPKNLLLTVGAAATITAAGLTSTEEWIALGIFVLVASLTIIVPVIAYLILGPKAEEAMTNTKDWLIQNNKTVMAVLLLVVGVSVIGDAIEILL